MDVHPKEEKKKFVIISCFIYMVVGKLQNMRVGSAEWFSPTDSWMRELSNTGATITEAGAVTTRT